MPVNKIIDNKINLQIQIYTQVKKSSEVGEGSKACDFKNAMMIQFQFGK